MAFAEIEPFCCSLLEHHYPEVTNLGDVRGITEDQILGLGSIDLVVYGFPCQDLSLAGKRKGLECKETGERTRSGLFYEATRIVRHAARHCGTRWFLFENVPGLLSDDDGRTFAEVIREICGLSFPVPEKGWRNSGVVRNRQPGGWQFAWRVFDAQYGGVPQRRQRVFAVGHLGADWRRPVQVLFEPESLFRNPPSRREAGARTASAAAGSPGNCGEWVAFGGGNTSGSIDVATACNAGGTNRYDFESETFVIAPQPGDPSHPVAATARPPAIAWGISSDAIDRSGEGDGSAAERAGLGIVEETSPALRARPNNSVAIAFQERGREGGRSLEHQEDLAYSLNAPSGGGRRHELNVAQSIAYQCHGSNVGPMGTLRAGNGNEAGGVPFVAQSAFSFKPSHYTRDKDGSPCEVFPPLSADADKGDQDPVVCHHAVVRRLMPIETERLMAQPDNWTLVPHNGRPASDSARYKAVGNSIVVTELRWLGWQFEKVQSDSNEGTS